MSIVERTRSCFSGPKLSNHDVVKVEAPFPWPPPPASQELAYPELVKPVPPTPPPPAPPRFRETQDSVYDWTAKTFPHFRSTQGRMVAIVEETTEMALAAGMTPERILEVVNLTLTRSAGQVLEPDHDKEEAGDLLSCVYAYAGERQFDVHAELDKKMAFNRSRPQSYYDMKTRLKQQMGLRLPEGG